MDFQNITKNTGALVIGRIINVLLSIFIAIYLTRYLGITEFGKYSIVNAYLSFFLFLSTFEINRILVREISKNSKDAPVLFGNSIILSLALSIVSIALSWLILAFFNYEKDIKNYVYITSVGMLFTSLGITYSSIFQVNLKQKYQVIVETSGKLLLLALTIVFISLRLKLIHFFILNLFIGLVILIGNMFFSKYFIKPVFKINKNIWKFRVL